MCLNLNDYQIKFFSLNQVLHAKSLQLCPTLFDLMDSSLPGSSVLGILQKRILEWVAMPSSGGLPDPGIEPVLLTPPALAGRFFTTCATWEAITKIIVKVKGL